MTDDALRKELKKVMVRDGLNEVDVASAIKMNPITVKRFVQTGKAHRNTKARFRVYLSGIPDTNAARLKAAV